MADWGMSDNRIDNQRLFQFSKNEELTPGKVFLYLYNTHRGTNFTEWIEGSFNSKMYVWSCGDYDAEKVFITSSKETRVPLKAVLYEGSEGKIPVVQEGISLCR
jgi:hypothetical protein